MSTHPNALLIARLRFAGRGSKCIALDSIDTGDEEIEIMVDGEPHVFRVHHDEDSDANTEFGIWFGRNEILLTELITYGCYECIELGKVARIADELKSFCSRFCDNVTIELSANYW